MLVIWALVKLGLEDHELVELPGIHKENLSKKKHKKSKTLVLATRKMDLAFSEKKNVCFE
jgi:hypothetical protein